MNTTPFQAQMAGKVFLALSFDYLQKVSEKVPSTVPSVLEIVSRLYYTEVIEKLLTRLLPPNFLSEFPFGGVFDWR